MKFLERALNILLAIAVVVVAGAAAFAWHEYDRLYGIALHDAENAVAKATGLKVRIGSLGGFWWHEFEAKDVRVYVSSAPHAALLAYVPVVRAQYSPIDLLRLNGKPVRIDIDGPILRLRRDAKGRLDLHLPHTKGPAPSWKSPVALRVVVHDGMALWEDDFRATGSQTIPFKQRFEDLSADVTWANGQVSYRAQGRDHDSAFEADGVHHLASGKGQVRVRLTALDVPTWAGYVAANDSYRFTAGTADGVTAVSYDLHHPETLSVGGKVFLSGISFDYEDIQAPIEHVGGTISFDRTQLRIDRLAGDVLGNTFTAAGTVTLPTSTAIGVFDPQLDLAIALPKADLSTIPEAMPVFTAFGPAGTGQATVRVTGGALAPSIAIAAKVDRAVLLKEALGPATAQVLVRGVKVSIRDIVARARGGIATGSISFTTDQHPVVQGDIDFAGVDLHKLITPLLTKPLPLGGRATGHATVSGPLADIDVRGTARIAQGVYGHQPINGGRIAFRFHRGNLSFPAIALWLPGGGHVAASGGMDGSGDLALRVRARNMDLADIRRAGFPVDVTGLANTSFDLAGDVAHPDTWEIAGTLAGRNGTAYGQRVSAISGAFHLADGEITLNNVVGRAAGALVRGGGAIGPVSFEHKIGAPDVLLHVDIQDADLNRIGPLASLASPSLGRLGGHATVIGGRIDFHKGKFALAGDLVASHVSMSNVGHLEAVSGGFTFGDGRLALHQARLLAGSSEVDIDGSVAMGTDPAYDLHIRTADADARSLLSAAAWPRLLQQTWLGGHLAPAVIGPQRLYAELPGRQGIAISDHPPINLMPLYLHWVANHVAPKQGTDIFMVTRYPFWKAIDGRFDADIRLTGTARHPSFWTRATLRHATAYGRKLAKAVLAVDVSGPTVDIGQLEVDLADGGSLMVQGGLGKGRQIVANAQGLDLSWLDPWLTAQQMTLGGRLGGQVVMSGDLAHPTLTISASAQAGHIDQFAFDRATAAATLKNGVLDIAQLAVEKDGKQALMSGTVPLSLRPEDANLDLSIDVEGDSLGILSVLTHGALTWQGGQGSLKVRVLGTEAEPRLAGGLELQGANLDVTGLTGTLTGVDCRVLVGNGIVQVENSTAHYGGGRIEAEGYVTLERFKPDRTDLQLTAQHLRVKLANNLYAGEADAAVHVGGHFSRPVLAGLIALSDGTITLPVAKNSGGNEIPVDLSDLVLNLKKNVKVVQTNLMDLNLGGNLIVNGTLAHPDPSGVVTIAPGGTITTFYTNDFRVAKGSVEFVAPSQSSAPGTAFGPLQGSHRSQKQGMPNARVNIVANGTVTDYDGLQGPDSKGRQVRIVAKVTGTLTNMKFHFQSDPPGYTEAEIESMLGKSAILTEVFNPFGATSSLQPQQISRLFVPGVFNFFVKRYLNSLVDPFMSQFFSDYSVDVVNNVSELQQQGDTGAPVQGSAGDQVPSPTNLSPLAGYDLSLSLETVQLRDLPVVGKWPIVSALPLTISYGHTFREASKIADLDSIGLNYRLPFAPSLFTIPLGVTLSSLVETNDRTVAQNGPVLFPLGIPLEFPTAKNPSVVTAVQVNLQGRF